MTKNLIFSVTWYFNKQPREEEYHCFNNFYFDRNFELCIRSLKSYF